MKKGQQSIALVLLGVVAIIAIIGLILLMKKTPSGYQVYNYDKPYILESGPLNWENLFAFAASFEDAEGWCPNHRISEGGFLDILQRTGNKQYRCYVVPPDKVPPQYRPFYQEVYSIKPRIAPVACFLGSGMTRPEGYSYPLWCDSGIYSVINYPYYTYPVYPQGSPLTIND
ncbi:MAG TPA: hypothetical protein VI612_03240 [Candidatus Nanoarchaeia archaeon]|nr:hypothetical protein [Candidatus Nanoarchaeia archaeon]